MSEKVLFRKGLVIGIIVLFIGIAIQPAISKSELEKVEVEPKEFLFQTIIDIANHPEVESLFEDVEDFREIIDSDYNFRSVILKLFFRNPRLLFSMFFSKPSKTKEYLDSSYNRGSEIINILGEEETVSIIESYEITNPEFFEDLNFIIMNNEELSNKIAILKEMNDVLKPDSPYQNYPYICAILAIIILSFGAPAGLLWFLISSIPNAVLYYILLILYLPIFFPIMGIAAICFALAYELGCFTFVP